MNIEKTMNWIKLFLFTYFWHTNCLFLLNKTTTQMLKKRFLLLLLPLFAFATVHKYYLSVTSIKYSEKEHSLQITSRIFIDDFDELIKERYDYTAKLASKEEGDQSEVYIKKYLNSKFQIEVNGEKATYNYIGREYDGEHMVIYLEVENVVYEALKSIEVENGVLTDLFDEQQNIVHFKFKEKRESFVLIKENNKGMLKF